MEESFRIGVLQSRESVLKSPRGCFILHVGAQKNLRKFHLAPPKFYFFPTRETQFDRTV